MTRTYALKRLLEHGDLSRKEIIQIMGGKLSAAEEALRALVEQGIVEKRGWRWEPHLNSTRQSPVYGLKWGWEYSSNA